MLAPRVVGMLLWKRHKVLFPIIGTLHWAEAKQVSSSTDQGLSVVIILLGFLYVFLCRFYIGDIIIFDYIW